MIFLRLYLKKMYVFLLITRAKLLQKVFLYLKIPLVMGYSLFKCSHFITSLHMKNLQDVHCNLFVEEKNKILPHFNKAF